MANIKEKIAQLFPQATIEGTEEQPLVSIADAQWRSLAKTLRDDADLQYDYLVTIVGMDWTDSLGCIYYLMSSKHNGHSTWCPLKPIPLTAKSPCSTRWLTFGLWAVCMSAKCMTSTASSSSATPICVAYSSISTGWAIPCAKIMTKTPSSTP